MDETIEQPIIESETDTHQTKTRYWVLVIGIVLVTIIGSLFWENIQGVWYAFGPAPDDITSLIEENNSPIQTPTQFTLSIYANDFKKPRVLQYDPDGIIFVSDTDAGILYALPDKNNDGKAERKEVLTGLNKPHGFVFDCNEECTLYVAETNAVNKYTYDKDNLTAKNEQQLVELPTGGRHTTVSLLIDPSDTEKLLVQIGSSCDVCNEENTKRATIQYIDLTPEDGIYRLEAYATGLRNAVFLTRNPNTNEIWATEMGRDNLGDNLPPDELNLVVQGKDYGWPECYGQNIHDKQFDTNLYQPRANETVCELLDKTPATVDLQAHSAPLGLAFIPKDSPLFKIYPYDLFVAYHGSWNRSEPTGYKIVRFDFDESGELLDRYDFITGWLDTSDGSSFGRPVDIEFASNGDMYVSDDKAGVVYKFEYKEKTPIQNEQSSDCVVTGCSNQLCSNSPQLSTCEYREEYGCYDSATCERQENGECGWTITEELTACLEKADESI